MDKWTLTDHRKQEYIGGATHNSFWTELELNGRHVAHFPDREMAEVVLAALTKSNRYVEQLRENIIELWHMGWTNRPLHEELCMTKEEYEEWMKYG